MANWQQYRQELLKDPAVRKAYDDLEPAYQMACAFIEARLAAKLTQTELAKKSGVTREAIARLESGSGNPTIKTMSHVAAALGKEVKLLPIRS